MYTTTVAKEDASASVMMAPDADQVNTSIWPGVSKMANLQWSNSIFNLISDACWEYELNGKKKLCSITDSDIIIQAPLQLFFGG